MKIIQCNEGHFYDGDKYEACPVCRKGKVTEVRRPSPQFMEWENASRVSDLHRTVQDYEAEAPVLHSFVTGWLVCVKGPERGRDYRLKHGFNQIGRSHRMDVCIFEDDGISRDAHCSVVYEDRKNQFLLVPGTGSLTWKEGALVEAPVPLKSGERFQIGETELEFIAFCRDDIKWEK